MIAGAVGFVGHLHIADDVVITGQTMVNSLDQRARRVFERCRWIEAKRWRKNSARFRHLDELARRVKALETALGRKGRRNHDE